MNICFTKQRSFFHKKTKYLLMCNSFYKNYHLIIGRYCLLFTCNRNATGAEEKEVVLENNVKKGLELLSNTENYCDEDS